MKNLKKLISLLLGICIVVVNSTTVSVAHSEEVTVDKAYEQSLSFLMEADKIENTSNGTMYTFNELDSRILKTESNNWVKLEITEKDKHNTIILDEIGNLFLDGNKIEITYENENLEPIRRTGGIHYYYSANPIYGSSSEYTHYVKKQNVSDIPLQQSISSLTVGALATIIGFLYAPLSAPLSVASTLISAFSVTKTKSLSCQSKIYTHKVYTTGNTPSGYCEKKSTRWFSKTDYRGESTVTTEFKNGALW